MGKVVREVAYIFARTGSRGGPFWLLVLTCGHIESRDRYVADPSRLAVPTPLSRKLAPKRVGCRSCTNGNAQCDPWPTIRALGGGESGATR